MRGEAEEGSPLHGAARRDERPEPERLVEGEPVKVCLGSGVSETAEGGPIPGEPSAASSPKAVSENEEPGEEAWWILRTTVQGEISKEVRHTLLMLGAKINSAPDETEVEVDLRKISQAIAASTGPGGWLSGVAPNDIAKTAKKVASKRGLWGCAYDADDLMQDFYLRLLEGQTVAVALGDSRSPNSKHQHGGWFKEINHTHPKSKTGWVVDGHWGTGKSSMLKKLASCHETGQGLASQGWADDAIYLLNQCKVGDIVILWSVTNAPAYTRKVLKNKAEDVLRRERLAHKTRARLVGSMTTEQRAAISGSDDD